ncbi:MULTISPECIES: hypothetical protein [Cupriavidus]|uniref:hypothetical protein n=1 Tax=unclassified Cupriavidus TaxID=2640874 RepID=UPI00044F40D9|nr:hypothetical protein [Cupriavidus sp. SK-3]KDP88256.1 hypothetical protein CF70_031490 [Cupriavidus sp. SK-3]
MAIVENGNQETEFWEGVRIAADSRYRAEQAAKMRRTIGWALGLSIAGLCLALAAHRRYRDTVHLFGLGDENDNG